MQVLAASNPLFRRAPPELRQSLYRNCGCHVHSSFCPYAGCALPSPLKPMTVWCHLESLDKWLAYSVTLKKPWASGLELRRTVFVERPSWLAYALQGSCQSACLQKQTKITHSWNVDTNAWAWGQVFGLKPKWKIARGWHRCAAPLLVLTLMFAITLRRHVGIQKYCQRRVISTVIELHIKNCPLLKEHSTAFGQFFKCCFMWKLV